jgi:RNA polymerase primary sigma factor
MSQKYGSSIDSKNIKIYLNQIAKIMPLSADKEKELGRIIQGDDKKARKKAMDQMVRSNLKFVVAYAKKYQGMGLSLLDLVNEGNLGLIEAAKRFDPDKNVKFISYAVWWIRQSIIHALTQYSRIYHIPQKLSGQITEMKRIQSRMNNELGRPPTREEIAGRMKLKTSDIEDMEIMAAHSVSLSEKYYDEDMEYIDKIKDERSPPVETQIIRNSIHKYIRNILEELDEKEVNVLKLRFGFYDNKIEKILEDNGKTEKDLPLTLQAIGDILNLTRERIRQIEKKAMQRLSHSQRLQQLRGYLI